MKLDKIELKLSIPTSKIEDVPYEIVNIYGEPEIYEDETRWHLNNIMPSQLYNIIKILMCNRVDYRAEYQCKEINYKALAIFHSCGCRLFTENKNLIIGLPATEFIQVCKLHSETVGEEELIECLNAFKGV